MHVTVTSNSSQHRASPTVCSLQLDILTQQAAELQNQADAAAATLAAAPAAGRLAAAESAAAEAEQQARLAAARLEPLQHEVRRLQRERDALQQQLRSAQQQLTGAAQQQPGGHSALTNGGASVADDLQGSADAAEAQLAPGATGANGAGVCLWCCALRILCARVAQGSCALGQTVAKPTGAARWQVGAADSGSLAAAEEVQRLREENERLQGQAQTADKRVAGAVAVQVIAVHRSKCQHMRRVWW